MCSRDSPYPIYPLGHIYRLYHFILFEKPINTGFPDTYRWKPVFENMIVDAFGTFSITSKKPFPIISTRKKVKDPLHVVDNGPKGSGRLQLSGL